MNEDKKLLSQGEQNALVSTLQNRFENNMERHRGVAWEDILSKLKSNHEKLWSLNEMEGTGGEPDVVLFYKKAGDYFFCDCSEESPEGRRNLCYDNDALEARRKNKPSGSAADMAQKMGTVILDEEQYRKLQETGSYDTTTSSWIATPKGIRELGGAIFGDRRYDHVFIYHNGADSYYSARGFRTVLKL